MCRRCGEPDRRGNTKNRRRRRARMLAGENAHAGNGVITVCTWCGDLLAAHAGYLDIGGRRLRIQRLEQDRLIAGGPYAMWNLVPACHPCNFARAVDALRFPDGCEHGTVLEPMAAAA